MNKAMFEQLKEEILKDWNEGRELRAMQKLFDLEVEEGFEVKDLIIRDLDNKKLYMEADRFSKRAMQYQDENLQD